MNYDKKLTKISVEAGEQENKSATIGSCLSNNITRENKFKLKAASTKPRSQIKTAQETRRMPSRVRKQRAQKLKQAMLSC